LLENPPQGPAIKSSGQRAGNQHFLFASDFPHEIDPDDILHEIEEVAEAPITDEDKRAVLRENAKRFYQI
jgi:predicted TIM-barrel fold metal-dependent hydrolase